MKIEGTSLLARIYVGESDTWQGRPLYEAIVHLVRDRGLAGATVLRGIEGFGASQHLHTTRILRLSEDLPVLIEVVDLEDRVRAILPEIDAMVSGGLITLERVEVFAHRADGGKAAGGGPGGGL
jgi:hypothetical protein